jgi:hypothetical protein
MKTLLHEHVLVERKMKKTTLLALLISAAPVMTQAETISGGLTLSYTQHGDDFGDMDTLGIDGRLAIKMDNGLSFGFDLGHSTMSQDGAPIDFVAEYYAFDASYGFGNGMSAGVFVDRLSMGVDGIPVEISLNTEGLTFGYEGNGLEGEVFYGQTDIGIPIPVPFPVDVENYGINARYTGMAGLNVGAAFHRARLSEGGESLNMDFTGVAATYLINDSFMVFGGYSQLDTNEFFLEVEALGLGVSYDLGAKAGFASSVSLELGRVSQGGSSDVDVVRLGLTVPLGKSGPVLPMNSVADAVLNPRRGAFNAGMTAGF